MTEMNDHNECKYAPKITKEEIEKLPLDYFKGEIVVVENKKDVKNCVQELSKNRAIGFDTETKPSFRKGKMNKVSLLQLSTENKAFLFRLHYTGLPDSLRKLLSNPDIIKIGAAIHDDIKDLQAIKHFAPTSFIDIQQYVKQFHIEDSGIKKLGAIVLNIRISKSQQVSNWENKILTEKQINYAATDAWICLAIYNKLREGI